MSHPVVCLTGGERGTCLGLPLSGRGASRVHFPHVWWKTYCQLK